MHSPAGVRASSHGPDHEYDPGVPGTVAAYLHRSALTSRLFPLLWGVYVGIETPQETALIVPWPLHVRTPTRNIMRASQHFGPEGQSRLLWSLIFVDRVVGKRYS